MSRPTRIQYKNACYHVMNRGRGRRAIFLGHKYYRSFLHVLEEASLQFGAVIHAYCLMGNHYHLLVQTPEANLDRIMRHVNGVYTQRYNKLQETDGPLFRGRYKAILIDDGEYFLQLTRYIHRNPVSTKYPLVESLEDYVWSSYPAYVGKAAAPDWLCQDRLWCLVEKKDKVAGYREYVESGSSENDEEVFGWGRQSVILGSREFRLGLIKNGLSLDVDKDKVIGSSAPQVEAIIAAVADVFSVTDDYIVARQKGSGVLNLPRRVAIYCSCRYGNLGQADIAIAFDISSVDYISRTVREVQQLVDSGEAGGVMRQIESRILIG